MTKNNKRSDWELEKLYWEIVNDYLSDSSKQATLIEKWSKKFDRKLAQELKRERRTVINKIKKWAKGKNVDKEKLRQFLNYLKEKEKE